MSYIINAAHIVAFVVIVLVWAAGVVAAIATVADYAYMGEDHLVRSVLAVAVATVVWSVLALAFCGFLSDRWFLDDSPTKVRVEVQA